MDLHKFLREYNPAADENLRAKGDTSVLRKYLQQAADEWDAEIKRLESQLEDWKECATVLQSERNKFSTALEQIANLDLQASAPLVAREALKERSDD